MADTAVRRSEKPPANRQFHRDHTAAVAKLVRFRTRPGGERHRHDETVQLFAALGEQFMQSTGHCSQNKIIYGRAVAMGQLVDSAHVHHDCAETPVRSGGFVQGAGLGTLGHRRAEFAERGEEPAERLRQPPQRADAVAPGVCCERGPTRAGLRKGCEPGRGRAVDEPAQNGQSRQPVPHDVVHDQDQSGPAISQSGNKSGGPQGTVLGQRLGDEAGRKIKQVGVVGL